MHIIGLIAEYNPLHLGHIYQIKKAKKAFPNSLIILITNSTFTERGEVAILNKWDKTKICLDNDIDLVIELPFAYATQSADIFAKGALTILNYLKIDTLIFGSESNNLSNLKEIAQTQIKNQALDQKVKQYLKEGVNYPTALSKSLKDLLGYNIKEPNDLLGISYLKEIIKNNYPITPYPIKRIGNYHETKVNSPIISASLIRTLFLKDEDISPYIPTNTKKILYKNLSNETYFPYLKYKILSTSDLSIYQTVDEGIENRIKKAITISNSWEELVQNIKTKRYTYNKVNRMLIHILTSFTKKEAKNIKIDYIRVLGFNLNGQKYLNQIKKDLTIPIITNYKQNISPLLDIEKRIEAIYYLPLQTKPTNQKPIIKIPAATNKLDIHPNNQKSSS